MMQRLQTPSDEETLHLAIDTELLDLLELRREAGKAIIEEGLRRFRRDSPRRRLRSGAAHGEHRNFAFWEQGDCGVNAFLKVLVMLGAGLG